MRNKHGAFLPQRSAADWILSASRILSSHLSRTYRLGDSTAFKSPRTSRPKHSGKGVFTTDADVVSKSITRAESKFHELQLGIRGTFPIENLSLGGITFLRLSPFMGSWSANLLAQCPNWESLCIAGVTVRGKEFVYDRLGNELCDIYWPHLKTLSLSQLAVGADEIAELLRRHKSTLIKVFLGSWPSLPDHSSNYFVTCVKWGPVQHSTR